MFMHNTQKKDKFELHLDNIITKLKECQNTKNLTSCSFCHDFLVCGLRNDYVNAVYNSMSKGDTGGFEF